MKKVEQVLRLAVLEPVRQQLRRMAAELALFPYMPREVRGPLGRVSSGVRFEVTPCSLGAMVYHDILTHGGAGTRRDVRVIVDRVIVDMPLRVAEQPTGMAAIKVAKLRLTLPGSVSAPMLPEEAGDFYVVEAKHVEPGSNADLDKAREIGRWVGPALKRHAKTPYGKRGVESRVRWARKAWRHALLGTGDDTLLWLDEMETLKQLAEALRMSYSRRQVVAPITTRLITLDDLDDQDFA